MTNRNIITASFLVLFAFVGFAQADELPLSDSFELGDKTPNGWNEGASVAGVQYVYDKDNASQGKRSLCLQKTANRYFPIAQWVRHLDHNGSAITVELSAKVKAVKATKAIIEIQFYDASLRMIGKQWIAYIGQKEARDRPASHTWKKYSGQAAVPAGTKRLAIALQIYGPGKVWFDELNVKQAGSSDNAIKNTSSDSVKNDDPTTKEPEPKVHSMQVDSGGWTRFVMMSAANAPQPPAAGYPVLFVLPGGTGSLDFQPFVQTICDQALQGRYLVIELVAPPHIVWPTQATRSRFATTEEAIDGILKKLSASQSIDRSKVFALAWSSSGPAVYASLLRTSSPLTGALIAMSVFKPNDYPSLANVNGKRIYLLHSPEDKTCPYAMATRAKHELTSAGASVQLSNYAGGHGWHGDVMANIRSGMNWLNETPANNN